jgi:hypothetical protein
VVNRNEDRIDVLRVLHDAMDVPRHWPNPADVRAQRNQGKQSG